MKKSDHEAKHLQLVSLQTNLFQESLEKRKIAADHHTNICENQAVQQDDSDPNRSDLLQEYSRIDRQYLERRHLNHA